MFDNFISVSHQTSRPQNFKVIHERQVAKMRYSEFYIAKGGSGSPPRKFKILEVRGCNFNALLEH